MSIELRGRGYVRMHEDSWIAVRELGRNLGWVPEYVKVAAQDTGLQDDVDDVPEHNARALARALYRAIHMIETDSLTESLVELVRTAGVGSMRAVADLAATDTFYVD